MVEMRGNGAKRPALDVQVDLSKKGSCPSRPGDTIRATDETTVRDNGGYVGGGVSRRRGVSGHRVEVIARAPRAVPGYPELGRAESASHRLAQARPGGRSRAE